MRIARDRVISINEFHPVVQATANFVVTSRSAIDQGAALPETAGMGRSFPVNRNSREIEFAARRSPGLIGFWHAQHMLAEIGEH